MIKSNAAPAATPTMMIKLSLEPPPLECDEPEDDGVFLEDDEELEEGATADCVGGGGDHEGVAVLSGGAGESTLLGGGGELSDFGGGDGEGDVDLGGGGGGEYFDGGGGLDC